MLKSLAKKHKISDYHVLGVISFSLLEYMTKTWSKMSQDECNNGCAAIILLTLTTHIPDY